MASDPIPIACTLTTADAARQLGEWQQLRRQATEVTTLADGVRMALPVELADTLDDLAAREASCCAFLTIATSRSSGQAVVDITSDQPDALPVISLLVGLDRS